MAVLPDISQQALDHAALDDPSSFYLAPDCAPTDAELLVGSEECTVSLPVHSQLLSERSPDLAAAMLSKVDAEAHWQESEEGRRAKRPRPPPVVGMGLEGFTTQEVVLFLRFVYQPQDASPAALEAVQQHLPVLGHLSRKCGVPDLLAAVEKFLLRQLPSAGLPQLASALQLAEELGLERLLVQGVAAAAQALAACEDGKPYQKHAGHFEAAQLGGLRAGTLRLLLGALASAAKLSAQTGGSIAAVVTEQLRPGGGGGPLKRWTGLQGLNGEYEWTIPGFSANSVVNELLSPEFSVGAEFWRLTLRQRAHDSRPGGEASVCLELAGAAPKPAGFALKAAARFTLINRDPAASLTYSKKPHTFTPAEGASCWELVNSKQAALFTEENGFLVEGTLTIRVAVVL